MGGYNVGLKYEIENFQWPDEHYETKTKKTNIEAKAYLDQNNKDATYTDQKNSGDKWQLLLNFAKNTIPDD